MRSAVRWARPVLVERLAVVIAVLLGIRFLTSIVLVAVGPPPDVLALLGGYAEAFEAVLPLAILPIAFGTMLARTSGRLHRAAITAVLGVHLAALVVWLLLFVGFMPASAALAFPYLAILSAAGGSVLCLLLAGLPKGWSREPCWVAYLMLLVLVPLAIALRLAAGLGIGTWEEGGVLHGNWILVNLPTLLLEFYAIGAWSFLVLQMTPGQVRRKWYAFLPLAAVVVLPVVFEMRPLAGYVFSALVTWGSNLALFVPTAVSLTLAVAAIACYLSTFLILPRSEDRRYWNLLLLGTLTLVMAGFFASMASVEGLLWGTVLVTLAIRGRAPRAP